MIAGVYAMRSRVLLAAVGALAVTLGAATAAVPALAGVVAIPRVPVAVVGGIAGVFALLVGIRRRHSTVRAADPPMVEEASTHPVAGTSFDDRLRIAGRPSIEAARQRRESREHLAAVAVDVLVAVESDSEREAEAALADGTWTDDPLAAAYFTGDPPRAGVRAAIAAYLDRRSRHDRMVAHVVDALRDRLDGEGRP